MKSLNEDWLAVVCGSALIVIALLLTPVALPKFSWSTSTDFFNLLTGSNLLAVTFILILLLAAALCTVALGSKKIAHLLMGVAFLYFVSVIAQILTGNKTIKDLGLEFVIFALILGMALRALIGVPTWLKDSLQSEFFIKTGLVLMGCSILFNELVKSGSLGMIQALIVVLAVWYVAFWLGRKYKIDEELGLMISSAVSICGVSAAIATCGAIQGDSKKLSYTVSLVLIVALPMMLIMPFLANQLHLTPPVAGAWIGGTIDTTGAVVATGAQLGEEALSVSSIVKLSQNVLLGVSAVAISFFWMVQKKNQQAKPDWKIIWERFPKFVLAFLAASLLYSFILTPETVVRTKDFLKTVQTALFAIAFVSIGFETDLSMLVKMENGRPALVFILAQLFNILFTLGVAYLLF